MRGPGPASTLAARVAASTRSDLYGVVAAGLGGIDGPYHGAATSRAHRFLASAIDDPIGALAQHLRDGERVPGFGHVLYESGDPRAEWLLARLRQHPTPMIEHVMAAADVIAVEMAERSGLFPNSGFALAVLAHGLDMRADAGEAIFAIARTTGWTAHALEEYPGEGSAIPCTRRLHRNSADSLEVLVEPQIPGARATRASVGTIPRRCGASR